MLQEVVLRALFPLPEFADLDRTRFGDAAAAGAARGGLRYARLEWGSGPDGTWFEHRLNGYGFRDDEWTVARPSDARRVLFVGDSFVEGAMAAQVDTIPAAYERATGGDVEAMNGGLVGVGPKEYGLVLGELVPRYRPDRVHLVLYANDLPFGELATVERNDDPPRFSRTAPRLAVLLGLRSNGEALPKRFAGVRRFFPVVPDPSNPWTENERDLEPLVEPRYADAMREGRLNPYLTNLLAREEQRLRAAPGDLAVLIAAVRDFVAGYGADLVVTFVPSRHQTTTHYLRFARSLARTTPENLDLTRPEYQVQRRALAAACAELGVPMLDVTEAIAEQEAAGNHLYWRYDDHMRDAGYRFVAERIAEFEDQLD